MSVETDHMEGGDACRVRRGSRRLPAPGCEQMGWGQVRAHGLVVSRVSDMEAVLVISKCFTNSPHRCLHACSLVEESEEP